MSQHKLLKKIEFILSFELIRFIIIGTLAAAIHFSAVIFLVQIVHLAPLLANVFAFFLAFQASYFGHYFFTFPGTMALHHVAYLKLIIMQISFFVINESLFYFLLSLNLAYPVALFLVLLVMPVLSFVISRRWIFS